MNVPSGTDTAFSLERMSFGGESNQAGPPARTPPDPLPPVPQARSQVSNGPDVTCGEYTDVTDAINALAHSLARTMVTAFRDVTRQGAAEKLECERDLHRQLAAVVQDLATTRQEVENLARVVSDHDSLAGAAREKYDRLAAEVDLLRQADGAHAAMDQSLRREIQDLAALVSDRLDALFGRLDLHNGELAALKSAWSGNSSNVTEVVDRLNRQAEAIRRFAQTQESEWATLERLGEVLSSLQAIAAQRLPASVDDL